MATSRRDTIVERFTAEAPAFARSLPHRDAGRLARLVACADPRAGERGLDVGCGPGLVAAALASKGAAMIGVDLTPAMLRECPPFAMGRACADAESLPFADGGFDLAVCRNTLHHVADPQAVISEMARVLRAGGRLVIEDMLAAEDLCERDAQEVIERLRDPAHARTLPRSDLLAILRRAGLEPVAETVFVLALDFDEWIGRPAPPESARRRARRLMEARLGAPSGVRAWFEDGRLRFERPSILLRAVRT